MAPIVYLISGATRGIGLGLVKALAARDDAVVFAGARNPDSASELNELHSKYPEKVHVVKLTSANRADNDAAVEQIKKIAGKLDVVIANAGIANYYGSILETPVQELLGHTEINVGGPMVLFQAAWPLLKESPKPTFAIISSLGGSIALGAPLPIKGGVYGISKAAVNFFAVKLHGEHPELVVLDIHPGTVETDMGKLALEKEPILKQFAKPIPVETSVNGILNLVDNAKRTEEAPKFLNFDGSVLPW